MGRGKYKKDKGAKGWHVSGKIGSRGSSNKSKNKFTSIGTLPAQDKVMWEGQLVNKSKRDAEVREYLAANKDNAPSLETTQKELLFPKLTNDLAALDINQINQDRRAHLETLYGGIGKEVKKVTNFMSPEKWNALSQEEQNRMNESWKSENTEYFPTEADDERNIVGNMELSDRNRRLRELQGKGD